MTGKTTIRRNGSWCVELTTPIRQLGKEITEIEIRSPDFDTVIRWGDHSIPSVLALMAELSDIPEPMLRCLVYPDADRVMVALSSVVPQVIRDDFNAQSHPFTSPVSVGTRNEAVDQIDPRFPKVSGPVTRIEKTEYEGPGFSADMPDIARAG